MTANSPVSVIIAEDDSAMRSALSAIICRQPALTLSGAVSDADGAIALAREAQPDVAIIDVHMPGGGERAAREIRRSSPRTKVLALSASHDRSTVVGMLEAGSVGYLVKGGTTAELLESIKTTALGRSRLSSDVTGEVIEELVSERQAHRRREARTALRQKRIERAIEDPAMFEIVGQPIRTLGTLDLIGVEALSRFCGPPRRSPHLWFAEAEEVGLRSTLELVAIERALVRLGELPSTSYLSVNASPSTAMSVALFRLLSTAPADRVVVEITEHEPIANYERLNARLARIHGLGTRIAIDDAGAGFASLRHILLVNPDIIKLDISLTAGIASNRAMQALAAGLISFAEVIGATIVAEGVESADQLAALCLLGVECGQGFHLGRPTVEFGALGPTSTP